MFGNFLYFIVVLLIYSTYQPAQETNFSPIETVFLFAGLAVVFGLLTLRAFRRLERRIALESLARLDHAFGTLQNRHSILAILLFAVAVYGLSLPSFVYDAALFRFIPTLLAVLFLALFVGFLAIVWACAYESYRRLYHTGVPRRAYILSNISFSIPVLLPWLLLSGISDVIRLLPFEGLNQWLSTTQGEVTYFLVFLFGVAVMGPAIIQKFWRCEPLEAGPARLQIERLCRRAGLSYANILYWPIFGGRMITAGVMGLIKKFRYILVTRALLTALQPEEIDAVIAHEIGHVKRSHLLFYLIFFVGYLLLSYASLDLIVFALIYAKPVYRLMEISGLNQATVVSILFSTVIIALFLIYFRFIFGFFMRNFERQADIYVYELFADARPLIRTFEKIALASGQSPDKPNWHHFSINERIAYLEKCEADRSWIARHHRKIRNSIGLYLSAVLLIGMAGYHLNYGEAGRRLSEQFFEKAVLEELARNPENPALFSLLGDIYYRRDHFEKTVAAYEQCLALAPDDSKVLNNLAWLYATCPEERWKNPSRALVLARRAAALEPAPHVLDTLAESCYANGLYAQAVAAEKQALAEAGQDRAYFLGQLKKFERALKGKGL